AATLSVSKSSAAGPCSFVLEDTLIPFTGGVHTLVADFSETFGFSADQGWLQGGQLFSDGSFAAIVQQNPTVLPRTGTISYGCHREPPIGGKIQTAGSITVHQQG